MDPIFAELDSQVKTNVNVEASAKLVIDGFQQHLADGIAAALAAGATPDAVQKLTSLDAALKNSSDALAASIAANTPGGPRVGPQASPVEVKPAPHAAPAPTPTKHGTPTTHGKGKP